MIAAPAAATLPIEGTEDSATIAASPATPAARPAALTLRLHYEMLCAQPGRGPVIVTFPGALRVPAVIPAATVLVDGKAAYSLQVDAHVVTVGLAPIPRVICQSFVPGTLRIVFTRLARLGNPRRSGAYVVYARVGTHTFAAALRIRR
jgi:hypothetical protein